MKLKKKKNIFVPILSVKDDFEDAISGIQMNASVKAKIFEYIKLLSQENLKLNDLLRDEIGLK